ncbi:hypothetical protein L9F63_020373 [Diploptera punctata]|uniref:Uncharacterized protein n=1 Tax=Diploptera punctata TaxID=6984 RepID=A0AAD7ZT45_DIPPU|nr:hypothetical protein L9F63_020373 [Diploptera punctata]
MRINMAVLLFVVLVASSQLFSVIYAAPADDSAAEMQEIMKECNETYPINPEYLKSLNETGSFPDETDKTPKCFVRCMLTKHGMMDDQGNFDVDKMKQGYKEGKYPESDAMIDMCIAENTETQCNCNKAYIFTKCLMKQQQHKFERMENEDDDDDGGSFQDVIGNFFREAGGVVLTVLTILTQFRDIIASALGS